MILRRAKILARKSDLAGKTCGGGKILAAPLRKLAGGQKSVPAPEHFPPGAFIFRGGRENREKFAKNREKVRKIAKFDHFRPKIDVPY